MPNDILIPMPFARTDTEVELLATFRKHFLS